MIPSFANDKLIRGYEAQCHNRFSEVQFYLHPRPALLLSAARPGRHLKFSLKMFFSCFFRRKRDPQSSNYLNIVGDTFSLTAIIFVRYFENEIPLTINHRRKMSTISGNATQYPL